MTILLWVLAGFVVYSLIALVLARLALKKEDGKLKIKKNSFFISYFYRDNIFRGEKTYYEYVFPPNTYWLYRGMLWGIYALFLWGLTYCLFVFLIFGFGSIIAFFCGYLPTPKRFIVNKEDPFKKMKCMAPWKIILPIGLIVGIIVFHKEISGVMVKIPEILEISKVKIILVASFVCVVFVFLFLMIKETKMYKKTKEVLASFVKKYCKEIEIQDE